MNLLNNSLKFTDTTYMKDIMTKKHEGILTRLFAVPKYQDSSTTYLVDLVRQLFPEYRGISRVDLTLKVEKLSNRSGV